MHDELRMRVMDVSTLEGFGTQVVFAERNHDDIMADTSPRAFAASKQIRSVCGIPENQVFVGADRKPHATQFSYVTPK